jgi:hypothetical protein
MAATRPYKRTCRQFVDGSYSEGGRWQYICHPDFAVEPGHFIRAFELIQKDLESLFDYVEPADRNLHTYSYRIHELLVRTCIEVEANCKAILLENGYAKASDLNMDDYKKLNATHHLSSYEIKLPLWHGTGALRTPFAAWTFGAGLRWYQAYNATKHDRHQRFQEANFENLLDAVSGLVALLGAQFHTQSFSTGQRVLALEDSRLGGFEVAIGGYFHIKFPTDWSTAEQYDFDWQTLRSDLHPIQTLTF